MNIRAISRATTRAKRSVIGPVLATTCLFLFHASVGFAAQNETDWPGFRGRGSKGVASGFKTAESWDVTNPDDKSVLWNSPVPGLGHSCPSIVGNQVFVATAVASDADVPLQIGRAGNTATADDNGEQSWMVLCFDKATGKELWRRTAHVGVPKATRHAKATHANTTVAVDGDHVVAFFGSEGLYCYDLSGNLEWKKDLGIVDVSKYGIGWGYASSPAIHDGHIVLVCDDPNNPYVVSLNLEDGEEIWRKSRNGDCERSWGTPLIYSVDGNAQVVVNGWPWIVSYDLATGDETWRVLGGGDNPVPTPFIANEQIILTSSHGAKSPIIAMRLDAQGHVTEADSPEDAGLIWRNERGGSYMSTPVVLGDYLYLASSNGVLRCYETESGKKMYEKRLGGSVYLVASLVAADDKIYCTAEDGKVFVIAPGPEFKLLSTNRLGKTCLATPAISEGVLYFRTTDSLLAIGHVPDLDTDDTLVAHDGKKLNILFIAVDDLRPSLGCYGDSRAVTPHIDQLASQGMRFDRAYCQVAVCNPSRASLMTGLRPDTLGVWTLPIHFREAMPDAITIPQWLRKFDYTAVSHGKIYHNPTPDPQSWSEPIRDLPNLPFPYPEEVKRRVAEAKEKLPRRDWRKKSLRNPSTAAPELLDSKVLDGARTDMCIEDLRRLGQSSKPFFLAMGFIRPHLAFVAPKKYWDLYDPDQLPVLTGQHVPAGSPPYAMHNNSELSHYVDLIDMPAPWDEETLPPEKMRELIHGYYACVSYVDAQIGRIVQALDDEGLRDNTIVVLWSDHGWKLGEYRGWGKMTNYEIDARVPLIISAPGMKTAGQDSESLVELLDLFPTLCELVGVDVPDFVEGKSLVPVLKNPQAEVHRAAVSQYYRRHKSGEYMGYSLRTDQYRYTEWREFATGKIAEQELYDHDSNEMETKNLVDTVSSDVVDELSVLLQSTHPPKKLVLTPPVHSSPSDSPRLAVEISFLNETSTPITVYPITPAGRRSGGKEIGPTDTGKFKARIGGTFVVESHDGTIHEIHSPNWPPEPVVIRN